MKKVLSVLLALAMLLSIVPLTALSAAAETAGELTGTGAEAPAESAVSYGVSTGDALLSMLKRDNTAGEDVVIINVNADISYYVAPQGVSNDKSCLLYACTVGQGKKILNLNGHTLHFYNDYSVVVDHGNSDYSVIKKLYRQCLFDIPLGADLTVNGNSSSGKESLLQYHGKLLNKLNAIDQRDIFAVRGGNLTVNSGAYYAGGEAEGHTWTSYTDILPGIYVPSEEKNWMLVGGTPIIAKAGNLTINGGFFEGRGLDGYSSMSRNCALYADSGMNSVVINDGHFKGASVADVLHIESLAGTGRFIVKSGLFEVDQNDACVGTVYHSYDYSTMSPGQQGLMINDPDPYAVYYCQEKGGAYTEIAQSELKANPDWYFRDSSIYLVYVEPKAGIRVSTELSSTPTCDAKFLVNGSARETSPAEAYCWDKKSPLRLTVDPESLYFAPLNMDSYGVQQSATATFDLYEYKSASNRTLVAQNVSLDVAKDSAGRFVIDLNNLSTEIKNKMNSYVSSYEFVFTVKENWKSRREYSVRHTGRFYVANSVEVESFACEIAEPAYAKKPAAEAEVYSSAYDVSVAWMQRMSPDDFPEAMDTGYTFKRDRLYSAWFTVTMKEGYTCGANPVFYVNGKKVSSVTKITNGFMAFVEYDMRVDQIGLVQLDNVPEPVEGDYAIRSFAIPEGDNYAVKSMLGGGYQMYWYTENGATLKPTDTFTAGKKYKVRINIETTDGYRFVDEPTVLINGNFATITNSFDNRELTVEYTFTCPTAVTMIDSIIVTIPEPDVGDALSYSAAVPAGFGYEVEDYDSGTWSDGVCWKHGDADVYCTPAEQYEKGEEYTFIASIVLTDPEKYQFAEEGKLTATVNGRGAVVVDFKDGSYGVYWTFKMPDSSSTDNYIIGDVDSDGEVTILDATAIQRHLAKLSTNAYHAGAADADEDGEVTILDATAIQRHLAKLDTNPHIGQLKNA